MTVVVAERARAKLNLVLRVGAPRADGMHPLASLFASIDLADEVRVAFGAGERDEIVCPGVQGPNNLAARALAAARTLAPELPPARVEIDKRIPVAAGLGGGSADAAAVLRAAGAHAGLGERDLLRLAAALGSDVPSRLAPGHSIVSGTGEVVEAVELGPLAFVLVAQARGLSTAAVYAELDRMRAEVAAEPDPGPLRELAGADAERLAGALANDLEPAALALRPELAQVLERLRSAGAVDARITGSGPTAFGLFADRASAERAAQLLDGAIVTEASGC